MKLTNTCSFDELKESVLEQNTELFSDLLDSSEVTDIFKMTDIQGETILHIACGAGNVKAVISALEYDADLNAKNKVDSDTPLHIAARNDNLVILMHLLNSGASVIEKNAKGNTPLHEAVLFNAKRKVLNKMVECCITTKGRGIACDMLNNDGKTPLDLALESLNVGAIEALAPLKDILKVKVERLSPQTLYLSSVEGQRVHLRSR
ncbi:ankyrin repeat family protein [Neorickettsia helminthoeca str. Oregon]|uniref:Ankyrin repeat family protein n=1 Tax=Neorickettsia helminthoeca str. Oregon TaxID=1286528 RepID=X5HIY1_9RICK|nr:ankyrin repeat domain-containing protein [Neorickettsia helminthoeca]AHX10994.1 ankyrin repeat family protein [Neorickettsia helminthoeca str. Oregon]